MVPLRLQARSFRVTVLDVIFIITASAALVVVLGGGTRPDLGVLQIGVRSASTLLMFAAASGALRLWLGRGLPLLPSLARPDDARLEAERRRFATNPTVTGDVWLCAAAALLGSLVWIAPHLRDIRQVPDPGDPVFSAWRVARLAHQLATDPRHLFDGNQFYPLPLTLTYSDATFLQGLLGAPFVLSGLDPLVVTNVLTLIAFPACGLAFFYAGWRLTGDPRAALVGAMIGAWYPFHADHYAHLELHWVMFVPLAIVGALRMLAAPRWTTGLFFGSMVAAQWLASMYVGVMLMSFLVPFVLVAALAWRVRPSWPLAAAFAAAAAVVVLAVAGLGVPYLQSRDARGDRGPQEVWGGSALPSDYGRTHARMKSYQWHSRLGNRPERQLFPGTASLVLGGIGLAPPLTGAAIATIVSAAASFDWSLGFNGLTYDDLYRRSVVHRGMRVPARFSVVVGSALALLAAFGASRLLRRAPSPGARSVLCAALTLAVLADLRLESHLESYWPTIPSIYGRVTPDMILAELPRRHDVDYMYFSTKHWAHLVGGYSGFMPSDETLDRALQAFPSPEGVDALHRKGATHLTYNCALETNPVRCERTLQLLDANPALERVAAERWERAEVRLYRFR